MLQKIFHKLIGANDGRPSSDGMLERMDKYLANFATLIPPAPVQAAHFF